MKIVSENRLSGKTYFYTIRPWLAEGLEGALHRAAGDLGELGPEDAQVRLGRLAHLDDLEADVLALPVIMLEMLGFQILWI